ncbi:MAG: hypothetical protein NTV74_01720 [Euryarchaeota archaeon]|nr:hypothetical protein [Euryarchaeota archaeon]
MKKRNFIKEDEGVAGVIEALLIVALVAVVISTIQLVYIPQVMNQREADHMDEVANQFSSMKAMMDLQSVTKKDVPISSPITLGSRELPYFVTARALGELRIVNDANYEINVDYGALVFPLTSVKYTAYNSYYLDGTMAYYIFQGGAIIRKQFDGETVIVEPSITVDNSSIITIHYNIPIVIGIEGKNTSPTDYKTCFIRTNYSHEGDDESFPSVSSIVITTEYPAAWNESLHDLLGNNVNINKGSNYVEITRKIKQINLEYREIYIYAQISPGWIE